MRPSMPNVPTSAAKIVIAVSRPGPKATSTSTSTSTSDSAAARGPSRRTADIMSAKITSGPDLRQGVDLFALLAPSPREDVGEGVDLAEYPALRRNVPLRLLEGSEDDGDVLWPLRANVEAA